MSLSPSIPVVTPDPTFERRFEALSRYYRIDDFESVYRFLRQNKDILDVALEARERILGSFESASLRIDLFRDPEEGWEQLFIVIRTTLSAEDAVERMDSLVDDWFIDKIIATGGILNITEEPDAL